jgi:hypothetical protein
MATDNDVIKKELEGIRDERRTHANTAQRIGNALLSLLGRVENAGGNFLRKDIADTAQKLIRFMEGLKLGDGEMGLDAKGGAVLSDVVVDRVHDAKSTPADRVMVGAQGFDLYMGDDGKSHMYVDYLVARAKFFAASAEVRKVSYSGGTTIFSNAGSTIAKVTYVFDAAGERVIAYKCYALADDGTTRTMNWWHVGMMALCQTFNVKAVESERLQNRYYWRMVIGVGQEVLEDSKLYDYVILSNVREFEGGEAMLPNRGVRVLADETGRVLRWGGVAVATVYDGELVSMAELFAKQEKGRTTDDGGNVIAQRVFYGYEAVNGGEPDAPAAGDVIVQVGDQIRWKSHGNVIKLSTSTEDNATDSAPAITMYHQIGALWETDEEDSEEQPVRNPYQWKEVTCVISPEQVLLNARRFKLFTKSVDNIIEPYVVMYTIVPSCSCIVRHTATRSTTPEVIEAETVKRVGNTTELLSSSDVKYMADVVWQDGNGVETMALTDVHTRGLYNVKSLKIKAYMLKDAEKMLAECDIAVLQDGADGKPGSDGAPGAPGDNGTDGESAIEVMWNPNPLVLSTERDSDGNVSAVIDSDSVARVKFSRDGEDWGMSHILGYPSAQPRGCDAVVGADNDGFYVRIKSVFQHTVTASDGTTILVPVTTASVTLAARYKAADGTDSYIYTTLKVDIEVSAVWGGIEMNMKGLKSEFTEVSNKYDKLPLKTPGQLTEYTSTIKQTARDISLKVSETAVGRKNLLVGSALKRQGGVRIGTYEGGGIETLNGVNGVNCAHVISAGLDYFSGLFWWPITPDLTKCIKIEKNKKYTASVWVKCDRLDPLVRIEIRWAENATGTRLSDGFSESFQIKKIKEWQFCSFTFDTGNTIYDYIECNFWARSKEDGITTNAWFCQPMLVEGDEYVGWSLSEDDAEYIGGNLLDNTDTLVQGGNLVVANGNLYTDANSYKGFPTRRVNLLNASDNNRVVLQWDLESGDVVKQGQDYMLSFWAKGKGVFDLLFYKDGNQNIFVEKSNDYGGNTSTDTYGTATIKFKDDYSWQQYWVHWRVMGSNLPKYVLIRCNKGTDMYVSQPKLEYGATVTEYRATKTDYVEDKSVAGKLLDTGIDIEHKQITLTADKTLIRTNDGRQVALFGKDGLNASLVKAQRLETEGAEAAVRIENGMIAVLGRGGVPNIKFGVNSDGYAVMQYFDNAGNLLYDLGPAGLAKISTQKASMIFSEWIDVRGANLAAPYIKKKTYTSSKGTYSLDFNVASSEANDRLLFGKYAQPGTLVSKNLGFTQLTHLYLYSAPRVDGAIVLDDDSRRGLGNLDLTKAADGVYFTKEWPLAENGKLTNVATGPYIPADAKIKDNMQSNILLLDGTEVMLMPRCYFSGWMKQDKLTAYLKPVITRLEIFSWQEMQISANSGLTPPIQQ